MERLTKTYSDGTHGASDSLPCGENSYGYKNLLIEKLGKYEDLEELIGIPLEEFARIFRQHIPDGCKHPKKAIVLTDGDVDRWRKYKDLEEQRRLIKLPCKVGDTVYVVTSPFMVFYDIEYDKNMKDEVYESYVSSIIFYKSGEQYRIYAKATNHFIGAYFTKFDFGKTVFLTKSEAEAKLKERCNND